MWHLQFASPPILISRGSSACSQADKKNGKAPLIGHILEAMHIISVDTYLVKIAVYQGCWEMRDVVPVTTYFRKMVSHLQISIYSGKD